MMNELYYSGNLEMCCEEVGCGFEPQVVEKICYLDLSTAERKIKYSIMVRTAEGKELPCKELDSLENIRYFDIWGCPDGRMTTSDKRQMQYKLQCEASKLSEKTVVLCNQGLQFYDNCPVYVFGDCVESTAVSKSKVLFRPKELYKVREMKSFLPKEAKKMITFMPGVTEMVFYASLFAVVRSFLWQSRRKPEFITVLVAPSGHLKTSLVRKYSFWLCDSQLQEISFRSGMSVSAMRKRAIMLKGQNLLVDDLHKAYARYTNDSQREHLDYLVRLASSQEDCANIFVTAESIKDMAIFSAHDRMLQIKIDKMNSEKLNSYKRKINSIPDGLMAGIAKEFAIRLTKNYEEVIKRLNNENFIIWDSADEVATRIDYHDYFIKLTEKLYCEYMCDGEQELSCHKELIEALEKNKKEQQRVLKEIKRGEEPIDFLVVLNEIFNDTDILLGMSKDEYEPNGKNFCVYNHRFYLTKEALIYALSSYLERSFSLNTVVKELKNHGILEMDSSEDSTKKFHKVRHLVISRPLLELYCKRKELEG